MRKDSLDSIDSFTPLPLIEKKMNRKSTSSAAAAGTMSEINQSLNAMPFCADEHKKVPPSEFRVPFYALAEEEFHAVYDTKYLSLDISIFLKI
jgi:hypothetical protein